MTRHVHVLGICGYATSGAALLAQQLGDRVTGSDDFAYPPVSDIVSAAGIKWENHSDPANLERWGVPDLVVVGNQTAPNNAEFLAVQQRDLPFISEIEFYSDLVGARRRLAVCGTHGKTTTASLLAHMLERAGMDPGFRLGSTSLDLGGSSHLGSGPFVFEGDEYTTAPWDRRPKFLHTRADAACVTRLELDHPDVYPTLDAYRQPFVDLVGAIPPHGLVALCADDEECAALASRAASTVVTYGTRDSADWRIAGVEWDGQLQRFTVRRSDAPPLRVRLSFAGVHNALNACAALILATWTGAPSDVVVDACADFRGPARRFEVLGDASGVTIVDDYAHHPTEVEAAIASARQRYGARRLVAIHTPHTYSRTLRLLEDYRRSFAGADVVVLGPVEAARERGQPVTVGSRDVAARVQPAADVHVVDSSSEAIDVLLALARPGDVMLVLSLGGFDKLAGRLLAALEGAGARR
jgi:UDP-N-acetylmuramate: L-alanyl-gamma-D-glutamyl-meso-diaminopimelate ligase